MGLVVREMSFNININISPRRGHHRILDAATMVQKYCFSILIYTITKCSNIDAECYFLVYSYLNSEKVLHHLSPK